MTWLKTDAGDYANVDTARTITAVEVFDSPAYWVVSLDNTHIGTTHYATQAAAQAAAQKLVAGIDPDLFE